MHSRVKSYILIHSELKTENLWSTNFNTGSLNVCTCCTPALERIQQTMWVTLTEGYCDWPLPPISSWPRCTVFRHHRHLQPEKRKAKYVSETLSIVFLGCVCLATLKKKMCGESMTKHVQKIFLETRCWNGQNHLLSCRSLSQPTFDGIYICV